MNPEAVDENPDASNLQPNKNSLDTRLLESILGNENMVVPCKMAENSGLVYTLHMTGR